MKIIWSPTARNRLVEILDHVTQDNSDAALHLIECIETSIYKLAQNPLIGRIVPEMDNLHIQEIVINENYGVIYELNDASLKVLTNRHFRRLFTGIDLKEAE